MWVYEVRIERKVKDREVEVMEEYLLADDISRVLRDAVYNCESYGGEVISVRRLVPVSRHLITQPVVFEDKLAMDAEAEHD